MRRRWPLRPGTPKTFLRPLFLACLAGLITAGCPPPEPTSLFFGTELVGKVTDTSAVVHMVTGDLWTSSNQLRLHYDTVSRSASADYAFQTDIRNGHGVEEGVSFVLDSLAPDTCYYYRLAYDLGGGWIDLEEHTLRTRREPAGGFRFAIVTDMHIAPQWLYDHDGTKDSMFENILRDGAPAPDFLFTLGDDFHLANQTETPYVPMTEATRMEVLREARRYVAKVCHSMMHIPVNGNHEGLYGWKTAAAEYAAILEGQFRYFPVPVADTFPEGGDAQGRYGAFTWGDALFVWLDTVGFNELDPYVAKDNAYYVLGDEQRAFLETTLAGSTATWKFVVAHHLFGGDDRFMPGYGRGNANGAFQHDQAWLQALMETHGVQAFFYGHDHVFSVSTANGVAYICAGKAGSFCPWYRDLMSYYAPYEVFVTDGSGVPSGHVEVDVSPTEATVSFVKASNDAQNGAVMATYVLSPPGD